MDRLIDFTGRIRQCDLFVTQIARSEWFVISAQVAHMIARPSARRLRAELMQTREWAGVHGSTME